MKTSLKKHLRHNIAFYILTFIFVSLIWVTSFDKLKSPKKEELITITYIGSNFNSISLEETLNELNDNKEIKKINVESVYVEGAFDLDLILRTRLKGESDIVIINKKIIDEYKLDIPSYFKRQDDLLSIKELEGFKEYTVDEGTYGLEVSADSLIKDYMNKDDEIALFISSNSINSGSLGENSKTDNAIKVMKYLLGAN